MKETHGSSLIHGKYVKDMAYGACMLLMGMTTGSCAKAPQAYQEVINVDVETYASATEFFDEARHVVLETNDSALIGDDALIRLDSGYERIAAYSHQSGFTVFDKDGRWLCSFDHRGEGPEEYINITDFYIHKGEIHAVDCFRSRIQVYSTDNGQYKRVINMGDNYSDATWLDDKYIALCAGYNSGSLYNMALLNMESGEVEKRFLPYKKRDSATYGSYDAFVGRDADGLYAALPYGHSLYRLTQDTCVVVETYQFNTRDQLPQVSAEDVNLFEMDEQTRFKRCVRWLGFFSRPAKNLCYQEFEYLCDYGVLAFMCKYNPVTGEALTLRIGAEPFSEFPYLIWKPVMVNNDYYICAPRAEFLLSYENISGQTTFSDMGLTIESNPVLFFYHLKQSW